MLFVQLMGVHAIGSGVTIKYYGETQKKSKTEAGNFIRITYRYLEHPTDLQMYRMENWLDLLFHLSNQSIAERKEAYRTTGKGLTYTDQPNALPDKRKKDPALRMVSQVCLQRVDKAYQKFSMT